MNEALRLKTVAEVIAAFGGVKQMRTIFGGVPSRFANYKAKGVFPPHLHMRIYVECMRRNLNVAPELVGMPGEIMATSAAAPVPSQMGAE